MNVPTVEIETARAEVSQPTNGRDSRCTVRRRDDLNIHPHDIYIEMVRHHVESRNCPDWLDVGCGWHFDWPWQQERERSLLSSANVTGIDPDTQAIARHRTIKKRTVGSVERLPFINDSFDLVTANVVVEHLKYPGAAFSEVFRVLRPGGVFVFRTPSARSYFVRVARRLPQSLKVWLASRVIGQRKPEDVYPAHYRANTSEAVAELCSVLGFRSVHVTVTRAQGTLNGVPVLGAAERAMATALGLTEGNLIVEAHK